MEGGRDEGREEGRERGMRTTRFFHLLLACKMEGGKGGKKGRRDEGGIKGKRTAKGKRE